MNLFRIDVFSKDPASDPGTSAALADLRSAGLLELERVAVGRIYLLEGELTQVDALRIADELLVDPVTEQAHIFAPLDPLPALGLSGLAVEVYPRPGVMDPVALTVLGELREEGFEVATVRTGRRFELTGRLDPQEARSAVLRTLASDVVDSVTLGAAPLAPAPTLPPVRGEIRRVELGKLDEAALEQLSRRAHLFLSVAEMRAIQAYYAAQGRDPTDLELETLAQTWSEHCVHKTLKSAIEYEGAPFPGDKAAPATAGTATYRYANLLKDTIAAATARLIEQGRGPQCLSVFKDNAGVIALDEQYGVAIKVETHNRPSAIEPYGGAATGIGGCIRDVIGCGLGARPIASTDVFCVAPPSWPAGVLPRGVLHPGRVLRGVVRGVADYGNRMGIPTVNGAVYADPRYLGNPLVFCGCVGLIPRDRLQKAPQPGDVVVVMGGRTGRDGIHGATFSSAELAGGHADEFSHAVQIGNAITEKRLLDAIMRARDTASGCLYSAITDCGAGGLSSAVGEMAETVGALIDLERAPLKYQGLRYDEIWISEAQERMVLAVPPQNMDKLLAIAAEEGVEATAIGVFGHGDQVGPRLTVRYQGQTVGDLEMGFLHHGLPMTPRRAVWTAPAIVAAKSEQLSAAQRLQRLVHELAHPTIASKEWIVRAYDHEVQGASVIKPLAGPGDGPMDGAVLRVPLTSEGGIALGCGLCPHLSDVDPYWMALAAVDEAIRNVVCVGGDPAQTAILDNFCWGRTDDERQLGALVRACQGCHDAAVGFATPFISGKDSLNNEFAVDPQDIERLLAAIEEVATATISDPGRRHAIIASAVERLRTQHRLSIPGTLLITALALVKDVRRCPTSDLKTSGAALLLVGGWSPVGFNVAAAAQTHAAVAGLIRDAQVKACHDVSDGGWLTAVAEMAIGGRRGVELVDLKDGPGPFDELVAGYVLEVTDTAAVMERLQVHATPVRPLGRVGQAGGALKLGLATVALSELRAAWGA